MDKLIANGSLAWPNGVLLGVFLAESGLLWSTAATLGSKPEALVEFEVLGRWGLRLRGGRGLRFGGLRV